MLASYFGFTTASFRESAESVAFRQEDIQMSEIFGTQGTQGEMFCNYPCIQSGCGKLVVCAAHSKRLKHKAQEHKQEVTSYELLLLEIFGVVFIVCY